ncbi:MAG: sensor histidine kinase [Chloroflexi bacterium]|nr:MAG: sensor histidine kinase [Chloroflexota bacterium]
MPPRAGIRTLTTMEVWAAGGGRTRERLHDAGLVLVAAVTGALNFALWLANSPPVPRLVLVADVAIGAAACLALLVARRWPVGVSLGIAPLVVFATASQGAMGMALLTVALHRRLRVAVLVGLASFAAGQLHWWLRGPRTDPLWAAALANFVIGLLVNAAVIAWGMLGQARRERLRSLRERAERTEAEQQLRIEQARHLERERIAREMHDVLAHRISLLSLHAGALEFHPDAPPEDVARAAGVVRQNAHLALEDLRRVIGVLRGPGADDAPEPPQPTLADVPALVEDSRQAGMRLRFDNRLADLSAVPASAGRDAYRIVQEALTNARKHAPACAVGLTLAGAAGDGLTIEVRNRLPAGEAAPPAIPGAGTGIVGLVERAALAGGRLEHGPDGGGYRLRAWLPWPA